MAKGFHVDTGRSCLEADVRSGLQEAFTKNPSSVMALVDLLIPDCKDVPVAAAKKESTREMPAMWSAVEGWKGITYLDENCEEETFDSPSALLKHLDISTSGIQCDPAGKQCRSNSQVESLQIHGYTVYGDKKGQDPIKGVTKSITVIHPDCVASMEEENKGKRKKKK